MLDNHAAYYQKNKEKCYEASKAWKAANRERVRSLGRLNWRKYKNPELAAKWRSENRDHLTEQARQYSKLDKYKTHNATKAAARRLSSCKWADKEKVRAIYEKARIATKETGVKYVVDHVIPIKNKLVSGLHNEFNLRVITNTENAKKKNKFDLSLI